VSGSDHADFDPPDDPDESSASPFDPDLAALLAISLDDPAPWEEGGPYTDDGPPIRREFDELFDVDALRDDIAWEEMRAALEALEAADEQDVYGLLIGDSPAYVPDVQQNPSNPPSPQAPAPTTPKVVPSKGSGTQAKPGKSGAKPRRRRDYDALPEYLPEACEFSDDPALRDGLTVMRLIKKHLTGGAPGTIGDLWDRTSARLDCSKKDGRKRKVGDWGLIYTAGFVMSKQAEMHAFWEPTHSSLLWAEAGFEPEPDDDGQVDHRRSYPTMWRRFAEMEIDKCIEALEDAADELVQLAMSKEPRIGRDVYVDATNTHSRARLHHDCPDPVECKAAGRAAETLDAASPEAVREARKEEALLAPEESEELRKQDPTPDAKESNDRFEHYVWIGKHRYGVLDPDVGVRVYRTKGGKAKKFWVGGLDCVATEGFTGATLRSVHTRANEQEYNVYPELMERVIKTLGGQVPEAVAGDRGYSIERVFEWNTRRGIASVFPYRKAGGKHAIDRHKLRGLVFDEHGVGRCPCCGGPGAQIPGVSFTKHGNPRILFTCADPNTIECLTKQWPIDPGAHPHGWRMVVPLSRLTPRYHAMRATSLHFEKTFRDRRKRYWLDGADETGKLKRFGLPAHRLRAAAARFLEWFRLCLRHGWINDPKVKRNTSEVRLRNGEKRRLTTLRARRWQGLDLPYGPKAHQLRLAPTADIPPYRAKQKK
jgi:hypothetical protein